MSYSNAEDTYLPAPPSLRKGKEQKYLNDLDYWLRTLHLWQQDLQGAIERGWLINDARVLTLSADKILSNSIFSQNIYVGLDQNIHLDGTNDYIAVYDNQNPKKLRIKIGKLGSGNSQRGIEATDASGTVIFRVSDITFINGAIIQNATITGAKIIDSEISTSKIANGAVTNDKISSLNANKITAGTLTVSSSAVAIDVTSGGAVVLRNGADIDFRASVTGNTNFISFKNSSGVNKAQIGYQTASDQLVIGRNTGGNSPAIYISDDIIALDGGMGGEVWVGTSFFRVVKLIGRIDSNIIPNLDNTYTLGTTTRRWSDVRSVLINGADYCFENQYRITEANHVYRRVQGNNSIYFLNDKWEVIAKLDRYGNLAIRGRVLENTMFEKPHLPRREAK